MNTVAYVIKSGNVTIGGTRCYSVEAAKTILAIVRKIHPKARIVAK